MCCPLPSSFVFPFFQSSAIVIRGLATGEIHQGNRWRVVWREARAGVASAIVLSVASFVRVLLTPGATTVATLAVSLAMGATVIGAVMFGTIAPIVLHGMGVSGTGSEVCWLPSTAVGRWSGGWGCKEMYCSYSPRFSLCVYGMTLVGGGA